MIYILAGIVGMCGLIGLCGLLEKLWDMLDPPAEAVHRSPEIANIKKPLRCGNTEAAGWNRFRKPVSTSTIPESGGKCNADI